ncbi:gamma carbonic anhydrase family protein [Pseudonocardia oroxyli]|uniref:Carbonic anhydrase or acetyltransferase, isoleucine patch superfamily n=1 Tax=Pseudonocardia oroxyli TaxID=366584 RepID=A0A1G7YEJ4_PSEOR|nr:gamma carbonic anhydrase family protein [Pseudonocardia oroxyli]SDG94992.1 Carbonic anhydrase or acetyltransferase, isoleucine patch superfamily [Pseudonocardia oroxyli]
MITVDGHTPSVDPTAWVAPGAVVAGRVTVGAQSSVWYTCVLRAEFEPITIGARSNLQDGTVVHTDPGFPCTVGDGVSVGHRVVLHGCTVEDDVLVGMGAVVMNGARIGSGSIVAAGAVVTQGTEVPPNSLVAGVPAKVRSQTDDAARNGITLNAATYLHLTGLHKT